MKRHKTVLLTIATDAVACAVIAALVLAPSWGWAQAPTEPNKYDWGPHMMGGGGWYGMIFGPVFMILALAAVIAVVVLLVRWLGGPWYYGSQPPYSPPPGRTPLDMLKERFARGEIDKDEFEERRRVLGE